MPNMKLYWKVRLYNSTGEYRHAMIETDRDLNGINCAQDFYKDLTGCKMLPEGVSETPYDLPSLSETFAAMWAPR